MCKRMRLFHILTLVLSTLLLMGQQSAFGLTKVERRLTVLEFFGGGAIPVGTQDGVHPFDFIINNRLVDLDADDVYDASVTLGLNYGQLIGGRVLVSVGLRYTDINVKDTIDLSIDTILIFGGGPDKLKWGQYDLDLNFNFYLIDFYESPVAPYVGLGINGGLTRFSSRSFETEYDATIALSANFGFDIKLFGEGKRSFVTLSSVNNWNFVSSGNRPKYLNIGGALKYWFRL